MLLNICSTSGGIMLGIRLERRLEARLEALAERSGKPKSYHARVAIRRYLLTNEDEAKRQSLLVSTAEDEDFESDTRG
jgi:predicted transcriptional regulator